MMLHKLMDPAQTSPLMSPLKVGGLTLKNRVVLAPMTTRLATADGYVTDDLVEHYVARARGGAGLITVELASPTVDGMHRGREVGVHSDRFLEGLRTLTDAIHAAGAACSIQLGHAGAHARPDVTGHEAVAPSNVPHFVWEGNTERVDPRPLDKDGIRRIVDSYAAAAARCVAAGFDMIEIQGGHDYLLMQFLSPLDNLRSDEYGGDIQGRSRMALEVVRAVRDAVGPIPISFRLSGDEFAPGGFTHEDALWLSSELESSGVSMLSVSAGSARQKRLPWLIVTPMAYPAGLFRALSRSIKQTVSVPVAVAGRLHDPKLAAQVLESGDADLIVLGRALLADPDWATKVEKQRSDLIRPCLACNTCVVNMANGQNVSCVVNPELGFPRVETPDRSGERILILGGGPAGLEAAIESAEAGGEVHVWERAHRLGGRLNSISKAPYFQMVETADWPFENFHTYLEHRASELGVSTRFGRYGIEDIQVLAPTRIIVATGAVYRIPGLLHLLKVPGMRRIASIPKLRKFFFKMLRTPRRAPVSGLNGLNVPVVIAGDRSGSRGLQAAVRTGYLAARQTQVDQDLSSK